MKTKIKAIVVLMSLAFTSAGLYAGGISSTCGAMYLGNLKIGQTYSIEQALGYPFNVTYKGRQLVDVQIDLFNEKTNSPDGFEPIPDTGWIEIKNTKFSLDPGQTGTTDIVIKIPNDEKLLGRKFYINVHPTTLAPQGGAGGIVIATGLLCSLRLEIAAKPPTTEEIRKLKKQMLGNSVDVQVTPQRIFLNEVEPGKLYKLKEDYFEVLKVINSSEFDLDVRVQSIPVQLSGMFAPQGYTEAENPDWLIVKKKQFKVKSNAIAEVPLELKLPSGTELGKNYYFLIAVNVKSPAREVKYISKLYVETKKPPEKPVEKEGVK